MPRALVVLHDDTRLWNNLVEAKMMRAIDAIGARVLPALHHAETDT